MGSAYIGGGVEMKTSSCLELLQVFSFGGGAICSLARACLEFII